MAQTITPDWVQDAVFYQIFPDRFAMSASVAKPHNLESWDSPPTTYGYKGGDLLGVAEHLDYLTDLGITAIYFNPIFQSTANHRYHTYDYFHVDPILGGDEAFRTMLHEAHRRGIRVILDGVFNHASRGFYQFNHALENGPDSPYADWFTFKSYPVQAYTGVPNYACWYNLPALPKLNIANPKVRGFILDIAEYWVNQGIDGWRLDVPEEIDDDAFWREFRTRVKAANPDTYIVGEIWHRADRWLKGDQFDAVMNYQLTRACLQFLIRHDKKSSALFKPESYGTVHPIDAVGFANALTEMLTWYAREITYSQLNLLDSHDTARFLTIARGDKQILKLAWLVMFAFPGAPTLYYGDEIGMEGKDDPDCRRSFPWEPKRWDLDLHTFAKRLITLRRRHEALRRGDFSVLYARGRAFAFSRTLGEERLVVALNANTEHAALDVTLDHGTALVDVMTAESTSIQQGHARIDLDPNTGAVFLLH